MRHNSILKTVRGGACALALLLALGGRAAAQTTPAANADPEFQALFQQVLKNPGNLDLSFRFAEVATRLGDYEAAIGALERMVFFNPNLPRVKLELGVLYFRLGSYEMARSYFESATVGEDTPVEVRARVAGFLAEIDRRTSVTQWSAFASAGLRYQSNANAGPSGSLVRAAGVDAVLDRRFVKAADWNAFVLGGVRHVYDFENQRGDVWETSVTAYYAKQFKFEQLNLGLVELQTGPRLAVAPDAFPGLAFRPYFVTSGVSLGDYRYLGTVGGGAALTVPVASWLALEPFVEGRSRKFGSTKDYPNGSEQTGRIWTSGVAAGGDLFWGPQYRWQARAAFARNDTRRDYTSYEQVAFDFALPFEFEGPWGGTRRWSLTPSVGFARTNYDRPNEIIDPFMTRADKEWRAGIVLDAQLYQWLGLTAQVQYTVIDSNLPNYDTKNLSITLAPTIRF